MKIFSKTIILVMILTLSFMKGISQPTNLDFSAGNLNGWTLEQGGNQNSQTMSISNLSASSQYSLMTASSTEINSVPITMTSPLGGDFIRIGQTGTGGMTYKLSQTFYVDASSYALAFSYGFVLQDGNHSCSDQPFFNFSIKDSVGVIIPSSNEHLSINSSSCSSGDPSFITFGGDKYKNWINKSFDLTNYIGTNITVEFLVAGCNINQGAHPGYAYIDASLCGNSYTPNYLTLNGTPYSIIQSNNIVNLCNGNNFIIEAPSGATSYSWTGGAVNGLTSQSVSINQPGSYYLEFDKASACSNTTSVTFNIDSINLIVSQTPSVSCSGSQINLAVTGADNYSWSTGATTNTLNISPTANTSYTVTGSNANGCFSSFTNTILVNSLPNVYATTSNSFICSGEAATLTVNGAISYTWSNISHSTSIVVFPLTNTSYSVIGIDGNGCVNNAIITQSVSLCTHIDQNKFLESVIISPNPTNGFLTINSKTDLQKIEVVSITGQVLLSEIPTSTNHTLHLDNFANSIYFVNMYQNNRIIKREKVVLNK